MDHPPYTESNLHSDENKEVERNKQGLTETTNNDQSPPQLQQPQNQQNEKQEYTTEHHHHQQQQPHQTMSIHNGEFGRYQPQMQMNPLLHQQFSQPQPYPTSQYLQPRQQPFSQPGLFSIPISQTQPLLAPLQTPNYVVNSYQQLPIQSPYAATQTPHFIQLNQAGAPQQRSRHLLDSKFEDAHGNLLSYNYDRGSGSSASAMHETQQHNIGTTEANELGSKSGAPSFNTGASYTHIQSSMQSQLVPSRGSTTTTTTSSTTPFDNGPLNENQKSVVSQCTRCKKEFVQVITVPPKDGDSSNNNSSKQVTGQTKLFKLCHHCRELQRQRSRRWQMKTKDRKGVCRRCGIEIPFNEQKYVLCANCRLNLRTRKAGRASQGKCIHCSGFLEDDQVSDDLLMMNESSSVDEYGKHSPKSSTFRVCQKCRGKDKLRRHNLEQMGYCNRCTRALDPQDQGRFKVCGECRMKKRQYGNKSQDQPASPPSLPQLQNMSTSHQSGSSLASQPGSSLQSYATQHYTPYPQYSNHTYSTSGNVNVNAQFPPPSQLPGPYMLLSFTPNLLYNNNAQIMLHQQIPYGVQLQHPIHSHPFQGSSTHSLQPQDVQSQSQTQDQNHNLPGQGQDYFGTTNYPDRRS